MAIFRQKLPIPGPFDIRIGLPRDKGFDPRKARKRLSQKANPQTTMNRFRSFISGAEGLYRPAKFLVALEFPKALSAAGTGKEFEQYELDRDLLQQNIQYRFFFLHN